MIRPEKLSEDSEEFVQQLGKVFQSLGEEFGITQITEPRRLLDAHEYRAAVIAAMTLLETTLRQRLDKSPWEEAQRPMSFRQILNRISELDIKPFSHEEILAWSKLRNEAVHSAKSIHKNEARVVVEGVERILRFGPH